MRRFFAVTMACVCVLCGGCAKADVPPVTAGFSCAVTVQAGDFSVAGTLSRPGAGQLILVCTAPRTLAGVTARVDGDGVALSRGGLTAAFSQAEFPQEALFLRLCRVLDAAALCDTARAGKAQGVCGSEPYTLTYDAASGYLCTLSVPNAAFSVEFSDFSPISA